jgi:hypothetical protein
MRAGIILPVITIACGIAMSAVAQIEYKLVKTIDLPGDKGGHGDWTTVPVNRMLPVGCRRPAVRTELNPADAVGYTDTSASRAVHGPRRCKHVVLHGRRR